VMDNLEFQRLFAACLDEALRREEPEPSAQPRRITVELHGAGLGGEELTVEVAASRLYLGPDTFYRIIDIGLLETSEGGIWFFVRPSDHRPGPWEETWDPSFKGPFKFLGRKQ